MYGPTQIILILSGGFAYAQINIEDPLHLVAPNNRGKTTAISTLQYLFIDDSRFMRFSQGTDQTKRHYFSRPNSFVLFDCITPTGRQVIGLHGTGPAESFQPQRFSYLGPYEKEDFLDGTSVRKLEDVKARLLKRGLRYYEPHEYRSALLGLRDNKVRPIGLVPVKSAKDYDTFRVLLSNLLHLHGLTQDGFRRFLVDICRGELRRPRLDVKNDYARWYTDATKQSASLLFLETVAVPTHKSLRAALDERSRARRGAVTLWSSVSIRLTESARRVTLLEEALCTLKEVQGSDLQKQQTRASELQGKLNILVVDLSKCRDALARMNELDAICTALFCRAAKSSLETEQDAIEKLKSRLATSGSEPAEHLQERLRTVRRQYEHDRAYLENPERVLLTWLRDVGEFSHAELDDLFRLINPALATVPLSAVTVKDPDAILSLLRAEAARFEASGYQSPLVGISRKHLASDSVTEGYADRKTVEARATRAAAEIIRLQGLLDDALVRDQLLLELQGREGRFNEAKVQVALCKEWEVLSSRRAELHAQETGLAESCEQIGATIAEVNQEIGRKKEEVATLEGKLINARLEHGKLSQRVSALTAPPVEWGTSLENSGEADANLETDDLVLAYKAALSVSEQNSNVIRNHMDALSAGLPFLLAGDEVETLKRLDEEIKAIPTAKKALNEMWDSLFVAISGALRHIQDDVTKIKKMVQDVSREMNRKGISNLAAVNLKFVEHRELLKELATVEEGINAPLIRDDQAYSTATAHLRDFLEKRPLISVEEMFDVSFSVIRKSGETKTYESLDKIESNGTCATIKVLLHLALARRLLNSTEFRFPFFLDEVGAIDSKNCAAIVDLALASGFVPILASIDSPKECVTRLYQPVGEPPEVVVFEEHCTIIEKF